ncbi:MAG: FtsQ-type POTRA domain-containing protein [Pseudomonadota bacterium]
MFENLRTRLLSHRDALLVALLLLLIVAVLFALLNRPLREIRVEGMLAPGERQMVMAALEDQADARILSVSLDAVAAAVRELGWAQAVTVRRVWPDTLTVAINRQAVVAVWRDDAVLTSTGQVITQPESTGSLPELRSTSLPPAATLTLYQQLERLDPARTIKRLSETPLEGWVVELKAGDRVVLGRAASSAELARRFQRFLEVRRSLPPSEVVRADARYAHGVAIKAPQADGDPLLAASMSEQER